MSEKKSTKTKHLHQRNKTDFDNSVISVNNYQDKNKNSVGPFYRGAIVSTILQSVQVSIAQKPKPKHLNLTLLSHFYLSTVLTSRVKQETYVAKGG